MFHKQSPSLRVAIAIHTGFAPPECRLSRALGLLPFALATLSKKLATTSWPSCLLPGRGERVPSRACKEKSCFLLIV